MPVRLDLKGNPSRVLPGWGPRICLSSDCTVSARALGAVGIKKIMESVFDSVLAEKGWLSFKRF